MRQRNIGWRLDYLLASQPLFDRVRSCRIERETGTSDHAPVIAEFLSSDHSIAKLIVVIIVMDVG